jgi:hypothetical protein
MRPEGVNFHLFFDYAEKSPNILRKFAENKPVFLRKPAKQNLPRTPWRRTGEVDLWGREIPCGVNAA